MKRFLFGLLASGLLSLGLAGTPAKVEAAPPTTALQQVAVQSLRPARTQLFRRRWMGRGWGGWGYGSYYSPYTSYYGVPAYSYSYGYPSYGYGYSPSYYGGYSYYTPYTTMWYGY